MKKRIYLSPPHMGEWERKFVEETFDSNWIAPVGPQINAFEQEFAEITGNKYAAAVSSGTAALHLALRYAGVGPGDEVFCSTLTFIGSVSPVLYLGATPVFIDSDKKTWNIDPDLLEQALEERAAQGHLPKVVIAVHLYGQHADMQRIMALCDRYGVTVIEDAAEALGAKYNNGLSGTCGQSAIYSFNGNKIITSSGGGMIVSDDKALIDKVRFWATQAKEDFPYYEHIEMGYNYRMSNVVAAIGRGQLRVLGDRVARKRHIFSLYEKGLADLPGINCMPEPDWSYSTRWLSCITIDPLQFGNDTTGVRTTLEEHNIESRPLWKPMHQQPLFAESEVFGGEVADELFLQGLCLPCGTATSDDEFYEIIEIIKGCRGKAV